MNTDIYYFSGSGNSLAIAREIAGRVGGRLVPVVAALHGEGIRSGAETVGMVFPVYDFKAPELFYRLVDRIEGIEGIRLFAVATYGICPKDALLKLEERIRSRGGSLAAGWTVEMPHSGLGYRAWSEEHRAALAEEGRARAAEIAELITSRSGGSIEMKRIGADFLFTRRIFSAVPGIASILRAVLFGGWDALAFYADDRCNGCSVCVRICPMNNVRLQEGRPVWGEECVNCFACLQWCPLEAIQAGPVTADMPRYHHPEVKAADIAAQKSEFSG